MIIGIAGNINSGKDTVASMLNYMFAVGKHRAKYADWLTKRAAYDNSYANRITHFADTIKDNLSNILFLDRDIFDNRKYKDELWYVPSTGEFIEEKDVKITHIKYEIGVPLEVLSDDKHVIVKLRTIIQLYAENVKIILGDKVWIKGGIGRAKYINSIFGYALIPDVRFFNEVSAIWYANGITIKINRKNNPISSSHCSENNDLSPNFTIENDGSLPDLFYKVLALYERIK